MIRSYKLFGGHELAALKTYLEERLQAWAGVWVPEEIKVAVDCAPAPEVGPSTSGFDSIWQHFRTPEGQWIAHEASGDSDSKLGEVLAGYSVSAAAVDSFLVERYTLAAQTVSVAAEELSLALLSPPRGTAREIKRDRTSLSSDVWLKGSSAVVANIHIGDVARALVLSGELVKQVLAGKLGRTKPVRLASRPEGIGSRPVRLLAVAGTAEVDVRAIGGLSVGHVVKLDTQIDQPITLVVDSKPRSTVCDVRLGSLQGSKAVVLGGRN